LASVGASLLVLKSVLVGEAVEACLEGGFVFLTLHLFAVAAFFDGAVESSLHQLTLDESVQLTVGRVVALHRAL